MAKDSNCANSELTVLSNSPLVAGAPLAILYSQDMSNDRFFVCNHFPIPEVNVDDWRLAISGEVDRELSLTYEELRDAPRVELSALLECAGNSRAIQPPIEGLHWDHGGVGSARWAGVPLSALLERAGVKPSGTEVLLEAVDQGTEGGAIRELGYAMSLPMEKALHPETLLSFEMNGKTLPPAHGFPLRAVVPGWFGMTSVKWLSGIRVLDHPFVGYHQTSYYVFVQPGATDDKPKKRVTTMPVKSLITSPVRGDYMSIGSIRVKGVAWSGNGPIAKVEISTDDNKTWQPAKVNPSVSPYAWQLWEYQWEPGRPDNYLVRARATDEQGNTQPAQAQWNFRGFANNSIQTVPVIISRL